MFISLLTHAKELNKNTGTGKLVKEALKNQCDIITWSRTEPNKELLERIQTLPSLLLYPTGNENGLAVEIEWPQNEYSHIILLDGTWQEARKIYNRSPYLQTLPNHTFEVDYESVYCLRKNQKKIGLCTAEVVLELLKRQALQHEFNLLTEYFTRHNSGLAI